MTQQETFLGTDEVALIPPSSDEKTFAILAHILTLVISLFAPLGVYLIKKEESAFVTAHAKESLNFQLTLLIAYFACFLLTFILIGLLFFVVVGIASLILVIIATIRASEGKLYKYPFSIKFIS